ncbi:hypothetical protein [Rhodanobacter sp. B05]|uniref:hypothetical protein n=1 Tax=Rhodanobacter sp. B05 TaxID=1945859 RepID=UPI00111593C9|nr:hypothetical protein [Rhodanobacter sp. B05]
MSAGSNADPDAAFRVCREAARIRYASVFAVPADGARYVGEQWPSWTKGMHDARLAALTPGQAIASVSGVTCAVP